MGAIVVGSPEKRKRQMDREERSNDGMEKESNENAIVMDISWMLKSLT